MCLKNFLTYPPTGVKRAKRNNRKGFLTTILGGYALRRTLDENFNLGNVFYVNTCNMLGAFGDVDKRGVKLSAADNANDYRRSRDVQKLHQS